MIITDQKILRQKSEPFNPEKHNIDEIVAKMKEAIKTAWTNGYGLAAIQIGLPVRVVWFIFNDSENILINPEITMGIGKMTAKEGCLSIPNTWVDVERKYEIKYVSNGKRKRAKGTKARLIQHEIDHLDGILIIDK